MNDLTLFTTASTVAAALAVTIGVFFPALAMGRAISQALDALARQPEAEKAITRTLFVGGDCSNCSVSDCEADSSTPGQISRWSSSGPCGSDISTHVRCWSTGPPIHSAWP